MRAAQRAGPWASRGIHSDGTGRGSDPPSIRLGISAARTLPSNHRRSGAPALPRQSLKAGPSAHPPSLRIESKRGHNGRSTPAKPPRPRRRAHGRRRVNARSAEGRALGRDGVQPVLSPAQAGTQNARISCSKHCNRYTESTGEPESTEVDFVSLLPRIYSPGTR